MTTRSLFLAAQERLRQFIRDNDLVPGDRLPSEAELAELFGVSRGALREATRSLQTLGVINAQHGNGLYVAEFSFKPIIDQLPYGLASGGAQFAEVLEARQALEIGLMPSVAHRATEHLLARCETIVDRMDECEARGESTVDADREFHLLLYTCLDNPMVNNLIEVFWELYRRLDVDDQETAVHRAPLHAAILDALRARDPDLAARRMSEHFEDVRRRTG